VKGAPRRQAGVVGRQGRHAIQGVFGFCTGSLYRCVQTSRLCPFLLHFFLSLLPVYTVSCIKTVRFYHTVLVLPVLGVAGSTHSTVYPSR
jgi:hypothetical protein